MREIAMRKPGLVEVVPITDEMRAKAKELAERAVTIIITGHIPDKFPMPISKRIGGYLGQFAFHQWQSGDWKNGIAYIEKDHIALENGTKIEADAELDGKDIEVKTTSSRDDFLAYEPYPFGLLAPNIQANVKIYDFYVFVHLAPSDIALKYKCNIGDAIIFGYSYGDEIPPVPLEYEKHPTPNRYVDFHDLHPIRFLKPGLYNTELARKITIATELNKDK
jgi:hypothetical protein